MVTSFPTISDGQSWSSGPTDAATLLNQITGAINNVEAQEPLQPSGDTSGVIDTLKISTALNNARDNSTNMVAGLHGSRLPRTASGPVPFRCGAGHRVGTGERLRPWPHDLGHRRADDRDVGER